MPNYQNILRDTFHPSKDGHKAALFELKKSPRLQKRYEKDAKKISKKSKKKKKSTQRTSPFLGCSWRPHPPATTIAGLMFPKERALSKESSRGRLRKYSDVHLQTKGTTVDGGNPKQPPGMLSDLVEYWENYQPQLASRSSEPSTVL